MMLLEPLGQMHANLVKQENLSRPRAMMHQPIANLAMLASFRHPQLLLQPRHASPVLRASSAKPLALRKWMPAKSASQASTRAMMLRPPVRTVHLRRNRHLAALLCWTAWTPAQQAIQDLRDLAVPVQPGGTRRHLEAAGVKCVRQIPTVFRHSLSACAMLVSLRSAALV